MPWPALTREAIARSALLGADEAAYLAGEPAADPAADKSFFESVLYNGASADASNWQLLGVRTRL